MPQSPYYYGVQRKALTGMGYGPYYGQRYMGGQGGQAATTELSEKYTAEPAATVSGGIPAMGGVGEQPGSQTEFTGQMAQEPYMGGKVTAEQSQNARLLRGGVRSTLGMTTGVGAIFTMAKTAYDVLLNKYISSLFGKPVAEPTDPFVEGLTTPEEATRGRAKSQEYSDWGMFGSVDKEESPSREETERGRAASEESSAMGYW